jgi:hypothetical protein
MEGQGQERLYKPPASAGGNPARTKATDVYITTKRELSKRGKVIDMGLGPDGKTQYGVMGGMSEAEIEREALNNARMYDPGFDPNGSGYVAGGPERGGAQGGAQYNPQMAPMGMGMGGPLSPYMPQSQGASPYSINVPSAQSNPQTIAAGPDGRPLIPGAPGAVDMTSPYAPPPMGAQPMPQQQGIFQRMTPWVKR